MKDNHPSNVITPLPYKDRMPKQWKIAQTRFGYISQKRDNRIIEHTFIRVLAKAKVLLARPGLVVFERDIREDNSHDSFTMHVYICKSFYFQLECQLNCDFKVEYCFNNCRVEREIRQLLTPTLSFVPREVLLKPDFNTFYEAVLRVQDKKYITIL
jgi:hypothetical protein